MELLVERHEHSTISQSLILGLNQVSSFFSVFLKFINPCMKENINYIRQRTIPMESLEIENIKHSNSWKVVTSGILELKL